MTRRVVVTGMGLITALGNNLDSVWCSLVEGKSGLKLISRFNVDALDCKIAGQIITRSDDEECQFDPSDWIEEKEIKKMDTFIHFGIAAAGNAISDSGIMLSKNIELDRIGVMIGSGIGGLPFIEKTVICLQERGPRRISPFFIPASLINLVSGHISIAYGFTGPNDSVVTACATGAHAISDSARIIKSGEADIMIAGSAESAICNLGIAGFSSIRALTAKFNDNPTVASRPWDKDRSGFVMGEGAGVLVLEEYEHAKKRDAKIYAELLGYGLTADAHHMISPDLEGKGSAKAMEIALKSANLAPENIHYINAHGTSTVLGDKAEAIAIKNVFKDYAYKVPISSTKSSIGHLLGASGSVEAIFSILAINRSIAPPTLNLHNPSEECDLNFVPLVSQEHKIDHVLSNSFGFGGANVALIFGRC